ncbi:uncharacterized protein LOC127288365 [Leptopilina boulardi]|uniref:uncharacterized protein LOC127288365 n=1 Tax=Leptopilina boulardi TaxID=63433 RepID=UPI0021F55515|nr:uncharacterized protein LOC127288365 [Leptopilina boulardi]
MYLVSKLKLNFTTMLKVFCTFFALIAVSNAAFPRKISFSSGHLFQGRNATGVMVKNNNGQQEIIWEKNQDNLKVYFSKIYEVTGKVETLEFENICDKTKKGSIKESVKKFTLNKLGKANKCPIRKGTVKIRYPISFSFEEEVKGNHCGPLIGIIHIVKNKQENSTTTPLLITFLFRGFITGDDC